MSTTLIIVITLIASISVTQEKTAKPQSAKTPATPSLVLSPCNIAGSSEKVKCGAYEVYENRDSKKGRKINLKVVVFPATGSERAPDPFVYIPGGPGSSATEDAPHVAPQFAKIRERRDLLFVDQRGTGGSHPLNCNFLILPTFRVTSATFFRSKTCASVESSSSGRRI